MGVGRAGFAEAYCKDGAQAAEAASNAQWYFVDTPHRCAVARLTGTVWAVANRLRLLSKLAERRDLRPHHSVSANPAGSRRPYRLGPMVHRWLVGSGIQGRGRGFKKSFQRYPEEPEDHALGRSRGGFGSKFHLVTDGQGLPLAVEITAGQRHESTQFEKVLEGIAIPRRVGRPRKRPKRLAGDKGYSYPRIREWLSAHGVRAVIPKRSNERGGHEDFDKESYRRRAVIEQCVGWLKECRRIGTRFEKLAVNFLAMFKLAMIQRYLKLAFSDRA